MIIDGIYDYHSDDRPFGAGHRLVVAYDRTPRRVTMLCLETLKIARLPVTELRHARDLAGHVRPRNLAKLIDRRRRSYKRHKIRCRDKAVREIVAELRRM